MKRPDISPSGTTCNSPASRGRRRWPAIGAAVLVLSAPALAGCGGDEPAAAADPTSPSDGAAEAASIRVVSPAEGAELIAAGATLLDVRTPEEYAEAHIDGAVLIDVQAADFEAKLADLPADASYVVYCRSGNRSAAAAQRMAELGFTDVSDMGGIADWVAAGYPVVAG